MVAYDYNAAKAALSDADKDRILAVYLNMTLTDNTAVRSLCPSDLENRTLTFIQVDWKKAAADYGSASVDSFKKMLANALKKVKEAETNGGTPAAAVGATLKSGGGKKRKAAAAGADDDEENATPVKKGRGRPRKNVTPKAEGGS